MAPRRALVSLALIGALIPAGARAGAWIEPDPADCPLIAVPAGNQLPFAPAGVAACPGVRPGALVETPIGFCTLNFLFAGADGNRYIATAGHCVLGDPDNPFEHDVGERVWARGTGPIAKDGSGHRIGRFRYAILKSPKDFALIQLDPSVKASPKLCWFGGPTATFTSTTSSAILLHHYGQGMGTGDVVPARTAYAHTSSSPNHLYAWGAIAPGDSGSPIITDDGKAVGVVVTLGVHESSLADSGVIGITRLAPQVARAEYRLSMDLRLITASLTQTL